MIDLLLYFIGGIIITLIIFDILNRYKIAKELKETKCLINQMNLFISQNHQAQIMMMSEHTREIIDEIKESKQ